MPQSLPLDPDREARAYLLKEVFEAVMGFDSAAAQARSMHDREPELRLPTIGDGGRPIGEIMHDLCVAAGQGLPTTRPGFLAYIPGGGIYAAALADFAADIFNQYTALHSASPALVELESSIIGWLATEFGYGKSATGLLTSGGSQATFAAVCLARDRERTPDGDLRRWVAYTSAEAHHSVAAACRLAGLPGSNLRLIETDAAFRLCPDKLASAIRRDAEAGLRPFLVVATAGTTNTGAVDPLDAVAAIAEREKLWLHVDAAYGGGFVLCPSGKERLAGIEQATSITFDPHKAMFLPYGTGCLLLRDAALLRRQPDLESPYLRDIAQRPSGAPISPADFGIELTRPFRGLRLWLPLILHGRSAFAHALEEKLSLAEVLTRGLREQADETQVEIVGAPRLTVIAFRLARRHGESIEAWNDRNRRFLEQITARGRTFLSATHLQDGSDKVYTLRACILSYRTQEADVANALDDIRTAALASVRA